MFLLASSQEAFNRLKSALNRATNQGGTMNLKELQASIEQCMNLNFTPEELEPAYEVASDMQVPLLRYLSIR